MVGHVPQRLRYAVGELARVVNIRTLTTHIGFVRMAVTAPGYHRVLGRTREKVILKQKSRTRLGRTDQVRSRCHDMVRVSARRSLFKHVVTVA
jgi:hypothetical protein